jgi:hypothetical protein
MVIGLGVALVASFLGPRWGRRLGLAVAAGGAAGLLGMVVWAVLRWSPDYGDLTGRLLAARVIYLLAIKTQLPVVQGFLGGLALWAVSRRRAPGRPGTAKG